MPINIPEISASIVDVGDIVFSEEYGYAGKLLSIGGFTEARVSTSLYLGEHDDKGEIYCDIRKCRLATEEEIQYASSPDNPLNK